MCQYSLEGWKTKQAQEGDTVYSVQGHAGSFHTEPDTVLHNPEQQVLTCVLYGQKLTIEDLQVDMRYFDNPRYLEAGVSILNKVGTRQVVTLMRHRKPRGYNSDMNGDVLQFDDGSYLPSQCVRGDCAMYVGIKPTLEQKLGVDTLAQVKGDMFIGDMDKEPIDTTGEAQANRWPFLRKGIRSGV